MDMDNEFLCSLLETSNRDEILDTFRTIPADYIQGLERKAYNFIKKYFIQSKGKLPTLKAVSEKFPTITFNNQKIDAIHYYREELMSRVKYDLFTDSVANLQNLLLDKNIEKAESILFDLVQETGSLNLNTASTVRTGLSQRKEAYINAKRNKGKIGFQLGVSKIDDHLGGLRDEMFVIMGKVGVGKTYLGLMFTIHIWTQHKVPVVIVTNELSTDAIKGRIDSLVAGFPYKRYRLGQLTTEEEVSLLNLKEVYKDLPELHVISGAGKTVSEIEYEILSLDPAMFFVDGLYLTDMGYNDQTKNTMEASRAYQRLIKRHKIPGLLTTQMMAGDVTKYARAIQEDADIVLKLLQPDSMRDIKVMELGFTKIREADVKLEAWLNWDFEKSDFSETDASNRNEAHEKEYL